MINLPKYVVAAFALMAGLAFVPAHAASDAVDQAVETVTTCTTAVSDLTQYDYDARGKKAGAEAMDVCTTTLTDLLLIYVGTTPEDDPTLEFFISTTMISLSFANIYVTEGDMDKDVCDYALTGFQMLASLVESEDELIATQSLDMIADESISWLFSTCAEKFPELLEDD